MVGNNEFEEAWLDEGFNTYSTGKVIETAYGQGCSYQHVFGMPFLIYSWFNVELPQFPFAGVGDIPLGTYFGCVGTPERTSRRLEYLEHAKDDELVRNGWQYLDGSSYVVNSYTKPGLVLRTLESYLGPETMARVMRTYQQRWRYRHPTTRDFVDVVNEVSGQDMNWFFEQFFYGSNVADYEVSDLRSDPLEGKVGVYDENGKRNTYLEQDAAKLAEKSKSKVYRSTVVVRRLGEALAPVDVVIRFDNGETIERNWDGKYRWVKFVFEKPSKVTSAEVDPQRKLALEENFTNNSRLAEPDNRGAAKWYIRWIFWLENLFFAAGFFS
jgi:aminopeptidase N